MSRAPFFIDRNTGILLSKLAAVDPQLATTSAQIIKLMEEVQEVHAAHLHRLEKGGSGRETLLELVDVIVVATTAARTLGRHWGELEALVMDKTQANAERTWAVGPNGAGQHVEEAGQ